MKPTRVTLSDPAVFDALAHPVRLDVLSYLMSAGPATASTCARAVGDSPSNCSYHLRVLAKHGLVEADASTDGRERPWRATITGFDVDEPSTSRTGGANTTGGAALAAATLQRDQRLARDYLANRGRMPKAWQEASTYSNYTLRTTPDELRELVERLDELIRPYIAATRDDASSEAELVHLGLQAFNRSWSR